ncbi:MAG: hypothetical protein BWY31_02844 [Lentisphaerae bacterium ADurb.Bin242]|nr:MAG: hypothetical protein BWY31_02844 [Lentisphaerae bacterium ADurb.Bin242]
MIRRTIQKELLTLAKSFPVITITGPRQSGKTTLAQAAFPKYKYVNLEEPDSRQLAQKDARGFLNLYSAPVIIDEVQRVPELLSYIQTIVDASHKNGQYILTGSHQPQLNAEVSQSLAGRAAILKLLPLSIEELTEARISMTRDEYIFKGFMPRLYQQKMNPTRLYSNYFSTYVERDVRQLVNIRNLTHFEMFIKLLAGRVGQLVNLNSLSNDIGVSATTLAEWLSVLEASYIVFRLPCYFENFGKRLIKSPKLYFTEVGLAAYLLGIQDVTQVMRDPLFGGLYENMVVMEVLKARFNAGMEPEMYFFRDSHGNEVDLLLRGANALLPVEIKASQTFSTDFADSIIALRKLSPKVKKGIVAYSGDLTPTLNEVSFVNFKKIGNVAKS